MPTAIDIIAIRHLRGFARDVTTIGHFGTGNLELTLKSKADIEKARHLIEISYEAN